MADQQLNFARDEIVLCYHGPLIYEAKILKAEMWKAEEVGPDNAGPHFFVHYKGWKQSWDEWVTESRVMKLNDENLQKQTDLQATYAHRKEERVKQNKAELSTTAGRKRIRELAMEQDDYLRRPEIRVPIPDSLKVMLVDDWEYITKDQRLVSLPRSPTISQLLEEYREFRIKNPLPKTDENMMGNYVLGEVVDGLKMYFERALPKILLYRNERQQYAEWKRRHPSMKLVDVYGSEHLLRLFVQLPTLISHTALDANSISDLKEHLHHILLYMQKHADRIFLKEYENAPPDHLIEQT